MGWSYVKHWEECLAQPTALRKCPVPGAPCCGPLLAGSLLSAVVHAASFRFPTSRPGSPLPSMARIVSQTFEVSASWLNMTPHWWHFDGCHCMVQFQHLSAHSEASTFTRWGFSSSNYSHKRRKAIHVPMKYHWDLCHRPLVTKTCLTARYQPPPLI